MKLITNKGPFSTFAELRFAYLKSGEDMGLDPKHVGSDEWDAGLLHASEVGYCPRMQCLRLGGAEKQVQANLTAANEALMFWVAYRIHYVTYEAMQWSGILCGHEVALFEEPWAGRADALFRPDIDDPQEWLYDCKTVRPNAMKYTESFPKEAHCLQLGAYASKVAAFDGVIEYVDRGGSNPPIECVISLEPWVVRAMIRMNDIEDWTHRDELPPILEETFVPHYRKARGKDWKELVSITLDASWECSYCLAHHTDMEGRTLTTSPCQPHNHKPLEVGKKEKGSWSFPVARHHSGVLALLESLDPTLPLVGGQDE